MAKTIEFAPQGGATGKVCLQLPNTNETDLDFVRNSKATLRQQDGTLVTNWGVNLPRYNFGEGETCPSLLLEPESTNLFTYSEDLTNGVWIKDAGVTVESNVLLSPENELSADKVIFDGTNNIAIARRYPVTLDVDYSFSFYVQKLDAVYNAEAVRVFIYPNSSASSTNLGEILNSMELNEWKRIEINFKATGTGNNTFQFRSDVTANYGLWGAQLEEKPYVTSYIPTLATPVQRNTETVSKTGLGSYIGQTEGSIYFSGSFLQNPSQNSTICLSDNTTANRIAFRVDSNQNLVCVIVSNGIVQTVANTGSDIIFGEFVKVVLTYKLNEVKIYLNGVDVFTFNLLSMPLNLNTVAFDIADGSSDLFNGEISEYEVYNEVLTPSESIIKTTL